MATRALKPIQAGQLRHAGRIERRVAGVDSKGLPTTTYELFATVRFMFDDYRPSEALKAAQLGSQVTTYITTRFVQGVDATMRFVHLYDQSQSPALVDYYDIQGIVRDATGRLAMQLVCVKRDAAGYRVGEATL